MNILAKYELYSTNDNISCESYENVFKMWVRSKTTEPQPKKGGIRAKQGFGKNQNITKSENMHQFYNYIVHSSIKNWFFDVRNGIEPKHVRLNVVNQK